MEVVNGNVDRFDQIDNIIRMRELRNKRRLDRQVAFNFLNNEDFRKRYRLSKDTARYVIEVIRNDMQPLSNNSLNISVELMVLTALTF